MSSHSSTTAPIDSKRFEAFSSKITSPFNQFVFMWGQLPAAGFMGLRIESVTQAQAVVSLPYGWRSQNPFRSIYFAAQSAAAEMSTGVLAMGFLESLAVKVSMLVVNIQGEFFKKADSRVYFTCEDGQAMFHTILESVQTGEGRTFQATSIGKKESGEVVSIFKITWSFKAKKG